MSRKAPTPSASPIAAAAAGTVGLETLLPAALSLVHERPGQPVAMCWTP